MNTKKRNKILLTLAVAAIATLVMATASVALTVKIVAYGEETSSNYIRTWSGEPTRVDLQINEAVSDANDLTITWTSNFDSTPGWTMTYEQVNPADPNIWDITFVKPKPDSRTYPYPEPKVSVTDDVETKTDSERFLLYDDACGMGKAINALLPTDFNEDCITNLKDFAELAKAWLEDYTPVGPLPIGL